MVTTPTMDVLGRGAARLVDSFFAELAAQLRLKGDKFKAIAGDLDSYSELLRRVRFNTTGR
jgi:hypothetical protein